VREVVEWLARPARIVAPPVLRIALAVPFFKSGLTKWDGFLSLSPAAEFLFQDEFKLHIFGQAHDFPIPTTFAYLDGIAEIVLPVLLVIGLATRFSALALLVMTGVIQLVVPDGWANFHLPWAGLALAIIALGPGALSLDHLLGELPRPRT
jgi:putative oxidoreductase